MGDVSQDLAAAREAHGRHDWEAAFQRFTAARDRRPLAPEDLDALSDASWWLGRIDACLEAGEAAFLAYLDDDQPRAAASTAVELAVSLFLRGDETMGAGWIGRAHRLLAELPECPEHGYLRYIVEVEAELDGEQLDEVAAAAREVQALGRRHHDLDLVAMGAVGEGRALLKQGAVDEGMRLLDEAMLAVLHQQLRPEWAGNIYCHLMAACHEVADIQRANEWTEATERWLSHLPAAVLFTGICRVHRSQLLQTTGEWSRAEDEAVRVLRDLADLHVASVAEAQYQLGEIRRLRGDHEAAERAYARARELGRDPQPGSALLQLAAGRTDAAQRTIDAALHVVSGDRPARAKLCTAQLEIALAAGDLDTAARACAELESAAATYKTSGLEAAALQWRGAVALAEHRPHEALPALRAACRRWRDVHAPYDAARACMFLSAAYDALGDTESSAAELAAACKTFEALGASVDARIAADRSGERARPGGLTDRELQVLELVATGRTNREVAEELVLSEKTIARHLSNIFVKLDVSTRTEAAAHVSGRGLPRRPRG